jgi:putative transposase
MSGEGYTARMTRGQRIVIADAPHHVAQRCVDGLWLFPDDRSRMAYLQCLKMGSVRSGVAVLAYCLMPDHVHLVLVPGDELALRRCVGRAHWAYARHINKRLGRQGHAWERRYFACALSPGYARCAIHYVERNPVRHQVVTRAVDYEWSSARFHAGEVDPSGLLDAEWLRSRYTPERWREILAAPEISTMLRSLREHTAHGLPFK